MKFRIIYFLISLLLTFLWVGCASMNKQWNKAKSINTIEEYQRFIEKYPTGEFTEAAYRKIDSLYFQKAVNMDTEESFNEYLKKYPEGIYSKEAQLKLETLDFNSTKNVDNIPAYVMFINKYPKSRFSDQAQARLDELYLIKAREDSIKAENEAYRDALKEDRLWKYEQFLEKYPNSKQFQEIKEKTTNFKIFKAPKDMFITLEELRKRFHWNGYSTLSMRIEPGTTVDKNYIPSDAYFGNIHFKGKFKDMPPKGFQVYKGTMLIYKFKD